MSRQGGSTILVGTMTSLVSMPSPESPAFREEIVKALTTLRSFPRALIETSQTEFEWQRVYSIEAVLRLAMPTVAFSNVGRSKVNRIVFCWNGMSVQLLTVNNKPVPTAEDLTKGVLGLIDDAVAAVTNALP